MIAPCNERQAAAHVESGVCSSDTLDDPVFGYRKFTRRAGRTGHRTGRLPRQGRLSWRAMALPSTASAKGSEALSGRRGERAAATSGIQAVNTMTYNGYSARVEYDERDEIFVGRIL